MSLNELLSDGKKPWCDLKVNSVLSYKKIVSLSASAGYNLQSSASGTVYVIPALSDYLQVNLPLPSAMEPGSYYEFYMQADQGNSVSFVCSQAKICLIAIDGTGSGLTLAGKSGEPCSAFAFEGTKINAGDKATLLCDGVNWYATAVAKAATSISFS